ncbi:MAG: MATE family efflux transporter [Clostridia bacterium]|nr:MATE family efflux transporter [Clostridia bacterium]MDD3832107.1 MATE family efflux transporter [Clostridia bacterium]
MKYSIQSTIKSYPHHSARQDKKDLTQGNILIQLLLFALPILFTNVFHQLYNVVDSIVVGRYVGHEALAAVGANNSISNLLMCLFLGLGAGGGVIVAQYYGAKDYDNVSRTVHNIIILAITCGVAISVAGFFLARPILLLIQSPSDVIDYSTQYLQIYFVGAVSVLFYNMGSAILRAIGNSFAPLLYLIVCAIINCVLDFLFVKDFGWGIKGAAWATVIAQTVSAILVLLNLILTKSPCRLSAKKLKPDSVLIGKIIKVGLPIGLQTSMFSIANLLLQASLGANFNSVVMAGWVAANKVDTLTYAPIQSFGIAVNTFAGQNVGARKYDRVKKGVFVGSALALCTALLVIVPMLIWRRPIIGIFSEEKAVIDIGARAMCYIIPFYTVFGLTEVLSGTLRGVGKTVTSASIALIGIGGVRVFWLYVIVPIWPTIDVLFFVHPISWVTNFLLFLIYYLIKKWNGVLNIGGKQLINTQQPEDIVNTSIECTSTSCQSIECKAVECVSTDIQGNDNTNN